MTDVEVLEPMADTPLLAQARRMVRENTALTQTQKNDVLLLLTDEGTAKIKIAEYLLEGKNMILRADDYNKWLEKLLLWSKHVYGDAPQRTQNVNINIDMSDSIIEAYKKRNEKAGENTEWTSTTTQKPTSAPDVENPT